MRVINFIRRIFISIFRSGKAVTTVANPIDHDPVVKYSEVQQEKYFSRKNNLVEEFGYDPVPVYSSDLSNHEPIGVMLADGTIVYSEKAKKESIPTVLIYKGYVIKYFNDKELEIRKQMVRDGATSLFMTEEEYNSMRHINSAGEDIHVDDIDNLKLDPNYAKPNIPMSSTVNLSDGKVDADKYIELHKDKVRELQEENTDKGNIIQPLDDKMGSEIESYVEYINRLKEEAMNKLYNTEERNESI